MTRSLLKSSTALVLSLALAMPMPAMAQQAAPDGEAPASDAAGPEGAENLVKQLEEAADNVADQVQEATGGAADDAEPVEAEPDAAAPEQPAEAAPAADAAPQAEPADQPAQAPEAAEPAADAPAPADDAPQAQAPAEPAQADQPAETVPAADPAPESAEGDAGAAPQAEEGAQDAAPEQSGEAPPEPAQPAEAEAAAPPADQAAPQPGTDAAAPEAAEEQAEEKPAADPDAAPAGTRPKAKPGTDETAEPQAEAAPAASESDAAAATDAAEAEELPQIDPQAEADRAAEAAQAAAPAAAAAAAGDAAQGEPEVTTQTVTEAEARSSSEEFETDVAGQPDQKAGKDKKDKKDKGGISDTSKAVLLGLGALAVGQMLRGGEKVVTNSGDRVVVEQDGRFRVLKDDDTLLRRPGSEVRTETYSDGSTRSIVTTESGTKVETIRAADGRVLRRARILEDGSEVLLFDDTRAVEPVTVSNLPRQAERRSVQGDSADTEALRLALAANAPQGVQRRFSLAQIREISAVRKLVPEIDVNSVNFETNSAVIRPGEAEALAALGRAMVDAISENPGEVFLIEGHTDAVGRAGYNLALSDRRAESLALALTEYFDVPPENMVVQGYGESDLRVRTPQAERANRRAAVRRITPLLN